MALFVCLFSGPPAKTRQIEKTMLNNFLKTAWRSLQKNRSSSFINIAGLSVGMAVAFLIGLWIWDELSYDKYHQHYDRIAQVMQNETTNGNTETQHATPLPLGAELRKGFGSDFKYIVMSSWSWNHILSTGDKQISQGGSFMEPDAPELFSLSMLKGTRGSFKDPSSILVSRSVAKALFGDADPIHQQIKFDNAANFTVTGVYDDLPENTTLHYRQVTFIAPWAYYVQHDLPASTRTDWGENSFQLFVQLADNADMAKVSAKIKDIKLDKVSKDDAKKYNPQLFLHPMSKWHLYSDFTNGIATGGKIQYVWLFGIIGVFVLLLACINFMNLSTARSERRAKEVGIRKAIGSGRYQLIGQFFCESILVAVLAAALALIMVALILPSFNQVAHKDIAVSWQSPVCWLLIIGFTLFTGILAGSYPALYLSSFRPVKVLKGTFRAGRFAAVPRQVLVVLQFTVSVILISGTVIVFKQIQFAKHRPVGYNRNGLINIALNTDDLHRHFDAVRADLLRSGAITEIAESTSSATNIGNHVGGIDWSGKDPGFTSDFAAVGVTTEFGKTVGWQFTQGRDFSSQFQTDSSAMIINETAVKYMGFTHPLGEIVDFWGKKYRVVGVIKDMVMSSPYEPVKQGFFYLNNDRQDFLYLKINPKVPAHQAIAAIAAVCKTYAPSVPFTYKFVDDEYARKFSDEEQIGKLSGFFTLLAIFISCLGLFGMASFMAGQRIREIGVRKVLGASVFNVWRLLATDFVALVSIALVIALPLAWYFMHNWLQHYSYRTPIAWWIFAGVGAGAMMITLLTVSYQSIKAALTNPIDSLRSE